MSGKLKLHQGNSTWWKDAVIYQIYPRSFFDSSNDGIGDLRGIIQKLDYLSDYLGIDAIWLNPIFPSPQLDFGYDVSDYCDVDPVYGNLETMSQLIKTLHSRNIKVIIDYIPNHTSDQHPWFVESRQSRDNPKRDWYIWANKNPDGSLPNNWGSNYGGSVWTWDEKTQQYYFHQFLKEQPDLNWKNPEVRTAMLEVLRFWLDMGIDGFRMDVVGMIYKAEGFPNQPFIDEPLKELHPNDLYNRQHHIYDQDQDEVHNLIKEMRKLIDCYPDRCLIGEVWYELPRWIKYYGEHSDEIHLPFNFRLINVPWEAKSIQHSVNEMENVLPESAWPNYVLGNHDGSRLASRIGEPQARVAAMLLLTLRGTPTLYYGDEIGLVDGNIDNNLIKDAWGILMGNQYNRDICRTPMQWDDSRYSGFSKGKPWLPVSEDYQNRNVESFKVNEFSILNLYKKLLELRRNRQVLQKGSYNSVELSHNGVFGYTRETENELLFVALNFTNKEIKSISVPWNLEIILSTHLDREEVTHSGMISLRANEGIVAEIITRIR